MINARLYWHIFVTNNTLTIVKEQLHFIERQPYPVTAIVINTVEYSSVADVIIEILTENDKVSLIKSASSKEFEFETLKVLYEEAGNYDFVGYFHTKGAVMQSSNTQMWRNLMNFYIIQKAEILVGYLEENDVDFIGVFGANGLEGQKPYIAGNFWWAKSSYIKRLPYPKLLPNHTRYDCELWVGLGNGKMYTYLDMQILNSSLSQIAGKYDTDKKVHGYMPFYDLYLAPFRQISGSLLEIGVYHGESLKLWKEVLPNFIVEGVDIEEKPDFCEKVHVGNQADRMFLSTLPTYNIIIDDGGHRSKEQIISLVSKLRTTDLYVIEDLHTSLPELYPVYHEVGELTCLEYLVQYPKLKPDYISSVEHGALEGKKIYIEQGTVSPIAFIL